MHAGCCRGVGLAINAAILSFLIQECRELQHSLHSKEADDRQHSDSSYPALLKLGIHTGNHNDNEPPGGLSEACSTYNPNIALAEHYRHRRHTLLTDVIDGLETQAQMQLQ